MEAFAAGEADVLVATSVIEVGIDVPNATVMLVEDAERYGISQLHQLRGRIGRGEHASLCLLFGPKDSRAPAGAGRARRRLRLAEIDLELRGEGELVGTRQHGLAQFRVAELPRDAELLERARLRAERIDAEDPELVEPEHALLADALRPRLRRRGAGADPGVMVGDRAAADRARRATAGRAPRVARPGRPPTGCARRCSRSSATSTGAARARPVRRLGRAGHRGAVAGGGGGHPGRLRGRGCATRSGATSRPSGSRPRWCASRCARSSSAHARPRVNTIWSSSTPHTAMRAASDGSSRRRWCPVLATGARVVAESDRRDPLELEPAAARRAPLRRHPDPHP